MHFLPKVAVGSLILVLFLLLIRSAYAVTIASQTSYYADSLNVWQSLQELGSNLSGTAQSVTFRVSTIASNLNQFDFTVQNSKIYDKDNNNSIINACTPVGYNAQDPVDGLTFSTTNVPAGYEDVTLDFSCRNYNFITGHKYLLFISNANMAQFGGKRILFASAAYGTGGHAGTTDQFIGGGLRYAFDNASCQPSSYVWNSQSNNNGCNIFTTAKDDLYFVLNNTAPPPRLPVVFIPGIGGSELKANQDIFWTAADGHGGTYSHAYAANEKIWVNQDEAIKLGDDDYFDILKLKSDGITSESALSLTNNLTPFGYGDIDSFFSEMGYIKGVNFFVFPYDWRKDVRSNSDNLDSLIETAKTASGQSKVNLVVHSLGGLVARFYISDAVKANKVNKLIELGVPHLGAVDSLKTLLYGSWLGYDFRLFTIGIPPSETKDNAQNMPSIFQLIPSLKYYDFYDNSDSDHPYPFLDNRDIDNNQIIGNLNYLQTKDLLSNLNYNMTVFNFGEQLHSLLDSILSQTNGVNVSEIVGTAQPTLGQIQETYLIDWPGVKLIPKTDEIYINGDDTVPVYSASLKSDHLDLSGLAKIYYVEQKHSDLVSASGLAMLTVKSILNNDNALPVGVSDQKINLEGTQLTLDDGQLDLYDDANNHCGADDKGGIEENIPDVTCTSSGTTKQAFVKKKAGKVSVTVTRKSPSTTKKTTDIKTRVYKIDKVAKTAVYKNIPLTTIAKINFTLDPTLDISPILTFYADSTKTDNSSILPISEVTGNSVLDLTPPTTGIQISGTKDATGIYSDSVIVSLAGSDAGSGILNIEYSLDNGLTIQNYVSPFVISKTGKTTIQFRSIDKTGNEEIPQTFTIEIAVPPTPTPSPTPTPIPTPTPSPTPTPTSTPTPSPTSSPSPTPQPSSTPYPTPSPSPASTPKPIVTTYISPRKSAFDIISSRVSTFSPSPNAIASPVGARQSIPISEVLGIDSQNITPIPKKLVKPSSNQSFSGLLIILGGIIIFISIGLSIAFLNQIPNKMNHTEP